MFEQFQSDMAITQKLESIVKELDYLENQPWFKTSQVVNSGFKVHATPSATKGIEMKPIIGRRVDN